MSNEKERAHTTIVLLETMCLLAEQLSTEGRGESLQKLTEQIVTKCRKESQVQLRIYEILRKSG